MHHGDSIMIGKEQKKYGSMVLIQYENYTVNDELLHLEMYKNPV